jgi:cardiolipin synthase
MAPSWLSKGNTVLEFATLAAVLADAAGVIEVPALPQLFVLLLVTIIASGVLYVWVWGRRALNARRAAPSTADR